MSHHTVFYPGSFDPLTYGHLDILERTAQSFNKVIVGILENMYKHPLFNLKQRLDMIEQTVKQRKLTNVEVITFKGLAVKFMQEYHIKIMIRGIRVISDFENEMRLAFNNKDLYPEMETFFLFTNPIFGHISSSTVKEIYSLGGDVSKYVPDNVLQMLKQLSL